MAIPDETLTRLEARLENLEQRVAALEHGNPAEAASAVREQPNRSVAPAGDAASAGALAAFSTFGKAMLGIAGAYMLRAVAESSMLPRAAVAYIAIVYAILWLAGAGLTRSGPLARSVYACTSVLIFAPMLWELTMSFRVLTPAAGAGALAAFFFVALALARKRKGAALLWTASATAATLALVLALAAHSLAPFLALLLTMLLFSEIGETRGAVSSVRFLLAAAADLGIWIEIYIYSSPQNTRLEYPFLGAAALIVPALALCSISAGSTIVRTVVRKKAIGSLDALQATIAFLLAACSLLLFVPGTGATALRVACFVLAAALYTAAYRLFDSTAQARNYAVFNTWSAALLLAAMWMTLEQTWLTAWLCAAAVATMALGVRFQRLALEFHSVLFLLAGGIAAGSPAFIAHALAGAAPAAPTVRAGLAVTGAAICYVLAKPRPGESWKPQCVHFALALLAVAGVAAMLVEGGVGMLELGIQPGAHHLALLRTLVLCVLALALEFAGQHARRVELTRIGYGVLAAVGFKLLVEDLRHGHFEYMAASIFLFALTLMAAPRVAKTAKRA